MTFLDLFAGIGGFRNGLEKSGHKCMGHAEIDKYANKSYFAMYQLNYCKYNIKINDNTYMVCRDDVYKNCRKNNCKGEWFAEDIKRVRAEEIPKAQIWTFGFPCTDISICGKRAGLYGERSGLFFNIISLLKGTKIENKPEWLIIENVKNLVTSKGGEYFTTVLSELYEAGYDCEWSVVNSKNFGVSQNRERVYIIGHIRGRCRRKIFPIGETNKAITKKVIDGSQGNRVYLSSGISITLTSNAGGFGGKTGLYLVNKKLYSFIDLDRGLKMTSNARCINTRQDLCISNHKSEKSGVFICDEVSVSKTSEKIIQDCKSIFICNNNKCTNMGEYCFKIRRLTPKECFRLQGFDDVLYERAKAAGISDSQLYKQAGNAVTVNIIYEIGQKLKAIENKDICNENLTNY